MKAAKRKATTGSNKAKEKIEESCNLTQFQVRVLQGLMLVPKGKVTSYKGLALLLGTGPRAVGQALKRNPFAPHVPCHRVISSTGRLGGFSGAREGELVARKRALLEAEGVHFDSEGRLESSRDSIEFDEADFDEDHALELFDEARKRATEK